MQKLKVASNEAGQRLDKLLSKYLSQAGKGFLYKMMRKKNITLNGKKCDGSERVEEGDEISLQQGFMLAGIRVSTRNVQNPDNTGTTRYLLLGASFARRARERDNGSRQAKRPS